MKRTIFISICLLGLSCTSNALTNQQGGTIIGGVVGGVVGGSVFHGSAAVPGAIGGVIVGGIVGGSIGKSMDKQDRRQTQSAAINNSVGKTSTWTNKKSGKTYTVEILKVFTNDAGRTCKEVRTTVTSRDGQTETSTSTLCKHGKKWRVVN